MQVDQDSAQVRVPPPIICLIAILIGMMLQWCMPLPFMPSDLRWPISLVLMFGSTGVGIYCSRLFKKFQTEIKPWKPTAQIVRSGPYRWSRNPIYLSFLVFGLGLACALDNLWIAIMQVPLAFVISQAVIVREEKYLEQKFGVTYQDYKKNIRRWL